ncbi:hypothetical protein AGABI1DRAFT_86588 [Agaricus bisporus var. burnettii JB137-S8]|uniref:alpha-1,2-Mannosidase n=1 Tax=Agaricus bisporus var. burnettii (strain JB137-S8 / ATCC MYA-4627 / FGSC 10392) TaxID=597362 RepID=K5WPL1_AGABU|nr:uncharacterized protein AGABI1DRAFT_86588 [Agaricus bisporus var. burnettii JB137-S8]EKM77281.1 hypothetical protein AGABI1DRAFT_86588 [Agaricus bisporus var. burnettii JB137-S8]
MIPRLLVALGLAFLPSGILAGSAQKPNIELPNSAAANKAAVVDIFTKSYEGYRKFAFGHDSLLPLSESFTDDRNGWGASIVDGMSTMAIMGLDDFLEEAVEFSSKIDFSESKTASTVSVFETTIRYLGGLLSAYELTGKKHQALIDRARELGDKLAFAFSRNNVIPFSFLDFSSDRPSIGNSNIAEAGTLALEWETLSKYTGNRTYADLAIKALAHIAELVCFGAPLPKLAAQGIDPRTGAFVGGYVSWGGGSDSYFEYLIKHARLSNTNDNLFVDSWLTAIDSSIKTLLRTSTVGNHVYLADFDSNRRIRHVGSHLACFDGGNWILGGRLLDNQTIVDIGLQLTDACWNTYAGTQTGIGPEGFAFISDDGDFTGGSSPTQAQLDFYKQHGFYITSGAYILRPEVLESNFYAFRATGDQKYLDRAAAAVKSFNEHLATQNGFAGLNNVNNAAGGLRDHTESFWFAEVLKYLYLTFDDPEHIHLDKYVFNTEAHPFEAPAFATTSGKVVPPKPGFVVQSPDAPLPLISPHPMLPSTSRTGQ